MDVTMLSFAIFSNHRDGAADPHDDWFLDCRVDAVAQYSSCKHECICILINWFDSFFWMLKTMSRSLEVSVVNR